MALLWADALKVIMESTVRAGASRHVAAAVAVALLRASGVAAAAVQTAEKVRKFVPKPEQVCGSAAEGDTAARDGAERKGCERLRHGRKRRNGGCAVGRDGAEARAHARAEVCGCAAEGDAAARGGAEWSGLDRLRHGRTRRQGGCADGREGAELEPKPEQKSVAVPQKEMPQPAAQQSGVNVNVCVQKMQRTTKQKVTWSKAELVHVARLDAEDAEEDFWARRGWRRRDW
jgi:hypothetical protein